MPGADGSPSRLILIVEDAAPSASALELVLDGFANTSVRSFPNGAVAWKFLESGDGAGVCAVVTDLDMPAISGLELIRRMRSSRVHAQTPVIVVSATTEAAASERALEAGANVFFGKPWSPRRVRAALEQLLYGTDGSPI
jgi:two-component system chemotaxis response regulator CheY